VQFRTFLELFSWSARFTAAVSSKGLRVGIPFDYVNGSCVDLTKRWVQDMMLKWVRDGRCWHIHFGTLCTMYSIARKKKSEDIRYSIYYKRTQFAAKTIRICTKLGITFSLENPKTSRLFKVPCIASALEKSKFGHAVFILSCCKAGLTCREKPFKGLASPGEGGLP